MGRLNRHISRRARLRTTPASIRSVVLTIICLGAAAIPLWCSLGAARFPKEARSPLEKSADQFLNVAQPLPVSRMSFAHDEREAMENLKHRHLRYGDVTSILQEWTALERHGATFTQDDADFIDRIRALDALRDGWRAIPAKSDRRARVKSLELAAPGRLLYCLKYALPFKNCGYTTRSHSVIRGLMDAGWHVRAVMSSQPVDTATAVPGAHRVEAVDNVTYYVGEGHWSEVGPGLPLDDYLMGIANHFEKEALAGGADIVVAGSNFVNALPALMAARRLGLPFVYEVRGLWEFTRASLVPEWADSEHFHIMAALEAQAAREADLVATLTIEMADELVRRGVDRGKILLVPNAADPQVFAPRPPPPTGAPIRRHLNLSVTRESPPIIGFAGSATAYEGLDLLVDALAELTNRGTSYIFVMVGDGAAIEQMKVRAEGWRISPFCRFAGRVPFDKVQEYLACMDVVVVPRLSLPVTELVSALKPLEAMAMGKALVLSDVSPHRIMAGQGARQRAWLFRAGRVRALADALQGLLGNATERARLGSAGRIWVERERNWKAVTSAYSDALRGLLRNKGRR